MKYQEDGKNKQKHAPLSYPIAVSKIDYFGLKFQQNQAKILNFQLCDVNRSSFTNSKP